MLTLTETEKRRFLQIFLFLTLGYGGIMGGSFGVQSHSILKGVICGILAGLAYGIPMTMLFLLMHQLSIKWVRQRYGEKATGVHQTDTIVLKAGFEECYALCAKALQSLKKCHVSEEDKKLGFIQARTGMTWKSFGEKLSVQLESSGADQIKITISSQPKLSTTIMDYGKNAENVKLIIDSLNKPVVVS